MGMPAPAVRSQKKGIELNDRRDLDEQSQQIPEPRSIRAGRHEPRLASFSHIDKGPYLTPRVWQIACGERGRRYQQLFLDHDVMFLGPGRFGAYSPSLYDANPECRAEGEGKVTYIRHFATEVEPGDLVLLRAGYVVLSIGVVDTDYFHAAEFDDVYGWDLEHCRRVIWQRQHDEALRQLQPSVGLFGDRTKISTFTRVHDPAVLGPLRDLLAQVVRRQLRDLPEAPAPPLTTEQLSDALFQEGLSYDACLHVERAVRKLRGLLDWYGNERSPGRPTEHEVVAHMILPLMLALGWSEQLLAIEWKKIDLAVFTHTPTDVATCGLVCEAKGMDSPMQEVVEQAIGYCDRHHLDHCQRILVADGGYFSLYRRIAGAWEAEPSGYFSLRKLRRHYLLPKGADAVKTLMALTPANIAR